MGGYAGQGAPYQQGAGGQGPYDSGQYQVPDGGSGQYPVQDTGQYPVQGPPGGWAPQGHPPHDTSGQYPMPGHPQAPGAYAPGGPLDPGWETGPHQGPYDPYQTAPGGYADPTPPGGYGAPGPPQDPYANPGAPQGGGMPQGGEPYDDPELPRPVRGRRGRPEPEGGPDQDTGWDPGPDQGEHAFFADGDDDYDDGAADDGGRRGRRGRGGGSGGGGKKRRSGAACLVVTLVLGGGIGIVGYFGYQFYEDRFGPPPDFAGAGSGPVVTVVIPEGASGYVIGQRLKDAGVVKSVDAFVAAQKKNPKGQTIQDGAYTLHKEMSGDSVVSLMLEPKSRNTLIVAEGRRNSWVYDQIDKRLGLKAGTTKDTAVKNASDYGLPDWAKNHKDVKDPLEGFLFPSSYAVAKGMKPEDVLQQMVNRAKSAYTKADLTGEAKKLHLDGPWELITVASLVQAEGKTDDDFRKMAEVVYNRLDSQNTETNGLLQFDSTYNYLMGKSEIHISESEVNSNHDPYNTYTRKGLTPGPIGNPGDTALQAALNPTHDGWIYFVATDGQDKTEFAKTYADFKKLRDKFNAAD
ncbi:endolytic transglycosylase MltG [Streptomyces sp. NPDC050560]|uniref:endolytic transglycosylase MltG n=1 Tax=Streptomyces sp. NPDC050560 TaxID=3365630 RepID=UPI00378C7AC4